MKKPLLLTGRIILALVSPEAADSKFWFFLLSLDCFYASSETHLPWILGISHLKINLYVQYLYHKWSNLQSLDISFYFSVGISIPSRQSSCGISLEMNSASFPKFDSGPTINLWILVPRSWNYFLRHQLVKLQPQTLALNF